MEYTASFQDNNHSIKPIPRENTPSALPPAKHINDFEREFIDAGFQTSIDCKPIDQQIFYCLTAIKTRVYDFDKNLEARKIVHFIYIFKNDKFIYYGCVCTGIGERKDGTMTIRSDFYTIYDEVETVKKIQNAFLNYLPMVNYAINGEVPIVPKMKEVMKFISNIEEIYDMSTGDPTLVDVKFNEVHSFTPFVTYS